MGTLGSPRMRVRVPAGCGPPEGGPPAGDVCPCDGTWCDRARRCRAREAGRYVM